MPSWTTRLSSVAPRTLRRECYRPWKWRHPAPRRPSGRRSACPGRLRPGAAVLVLSSAAARARCVASRRHGQGCVTEAAPFEAAPGRLAGWLTQDLRDEVVPLAFSREIERAHFESRRRLITRRNQLGGRKLGNLAVALRIESKQLVERVPYAAPQELGVDRLLLRPGVLDDGVKERDPVLQGTTVLDEDLGERMRCERKGLLALLAGVRTSMPAPAASSYCAPWPSSSPLPTSRIHSTEARRAACVSLRRSSGPRRDCTASSDPVKPIVPRFTAPSTGETGTAAWTARHGGNVVVRGYWAACVVAP